MTWGVIGCRRARYGGGRLRFAGGASKSAGDPDWAIHRTSSEIEDREEREDK
jgi:hypothetical protein